MKNMEPFPQSLQILQNLSQNISALGEIHPKVSPGLKRDLIEASNNSLWRREDRSLRGRAVAVQRPATGAIAN